MSDRLTGAGVADVAVACHAASTPISAGVAVSGTLPAVVAMVVWSVVVGVVLVSVHLVTAGRRPVRPHRTSQTWAACRRLACWQLLSAIPAILSVSAAYVRQQHVSCYIISACKHASGTPPCRTGRGADGPVVGVVGVVVGELSRAMVAREVAVRQRAAHTPYASHPCR